MNKFFQGYAKLNEKKEFSKTTLIIIALVLWLPTLYGIADYIAKN